uniref:SET domain bifurcated histone lysine methyltransferase 1b n=1 Tax=Eptatretus burgeri TaxID=7764 RepID=A0A8C4Q2F9_EPTBU
MLCNCSLDLLPLLRTKGQCFYKSTDGLCLVILCSNNLSSSYEPKYGMQVDKRCEWIYRGSTRLAPMYDRMVSYGVSAERKSGQRMRPNTAGRYRGPVVQYMHEEPSQAGQVATAQPVLQTEGHSEPVGISPAPQVQRSPRPQAPPKQVVSSSPQPAGQIPLIRQNSSHSESSLGSSLVTVRKQVAKKSTSSLPTNLISRVAPPETSWTTSSELRPLPRNIGEHETQEIPQYSPIFVSSNYHLEALDTYPLYMAPREKLFFCPHVCSPLCLQRVRPSRTDIYRGRNPLLIPLLYDFQRICARRNIARKTTFNMLYKAPCGRSLRNMSEVCDYLFFTDADFLFLEQFCFDPYVLVQRRMPMSQLFFSVRDISGGVEDVPVSCVNEIDSRPPPAVSYSKERIPATGVFINTSVDFLVGCNCTDGCRDRNKCSCNQLSIEASGCSPGGVFNRESGYKDKRLEECIPTGVYECSKRCSCNAQMCQNRLVQHGLQVRLQLFNTLTKGWGIRCLDDIEKGSFVCIYAGKILTDDFADKEGLEMGDEYFANLDHIESVERNKEGYESEAASSSSSSGVDRKATGEDDEDEDESDLNDDSYDSEDNGVQASRRPAGQDDSSGSSKVPPAYVRKVMKKKQLRQYQTQTSAGSAAAVQGRSGRLLAKASTQAAVSSAALPATAETASSKVASWLSANSMGVHPDKAADGSASVQMTKTAQDKAAAASRKQMTHEYKDDEVMVLSSGSEAEGLDPPQTVSKMPAQVAPVQRKPNPVCPSDDVQTISSGSDSDGAEGKRRPEDSTSKSSEDKPTKPQVAIKTTRCFAFKSTSRGVAIKSTSRPTRNQSMKDSSGMRRASNDNVEDLGMVKKTTRQLFNGEDSCYIIDAKLIGNLGRYLNHSCSPNLFVQNVFVDTHDLRLPWVAFFASKRIRAGTELTWDYNYEVGSVPGKQLLCYCGSSECRGRLL